MHSRAKKRYILIGAALGLCVPAAASVMLFVLPAGTTQDVAYTVWAAPALPFAYLAVFILRALDADPERFALGWMLGMGPSLSFLLWPLIGALCGWLVFGLRERLPRRSCSAAVLASGIVGLLVVAVVVCAVRARGRVEPPSYPSFAKVCEMSKVPLDRVPDAKLLNSVWLKDEGGHSLLAKVEIARSHVEKLLAILPEGSVTFTDYRCGVYSHPYNAEVSWWNPGAAQRFVAAEIPHADDPRAGPTRILISLDQPKRSVVYVEWFYWPGQ